jgi:preprotein translocase subunit SecG
VNTAIIVVHVIFSLLLVGFILLHRGQGGGLSDMFGGGAASVQGSATVERNLNRLTVGAAVGFTVTTILLGILL